MKGEKRGKKAGSREYEKWEQKRVGSCVGSHRQGRVESDRGWLGGGAGQPVCDLAALCFLEQRLSIGAEALLGYGLVQVEAGLQAGRGA